MGGFGEQAALNVLVLLDGRRINDVDLSGVDWNQIPLENIERIEVVRGGSAAVLYGDNATGGVISIITKSGKDKVKADFYASYGSYDMNIQGLSFEGKSVDNKLSYFLGGSHGATHGYRKNTFNKSKDFYSKLGYDINDILSIGFKSGFYQSSYGLPGALYQSNIDEYGRRYARYGDDHVNNKDYYFALIPKIDLNTYGEFNFDFSYRTKKTYSYFLTSGLDTQKNNIDTFGFLTKYSVNSRIFGFTNNLVSGADCYRTVYKSNTYLISDDSALNKYTHINKNSLGIYFQDDLFIKDNFSLTGGYRYELARYAFGYHDNDLHGWGQNPDIGTKLKTDMSAFNFGATYVYGKDSSIFLNINKSFRFPQVDEFTYIDTNYQQQLNTGLKPQSSINFQAGLRHSFNDKIRAEISAFRMNIKDELYYNAKDVLVWGFWNGKNANYDRTVHQGMECSANIKLNEKLEFFGNYAFLDTYFDGGEYNKNSIPLTPRNKASIGFRLNPIKSVSINMVGTYVGNRYYLNDQANAYSRLNGYMVADTNISWSYNDFKVAFGINNLFGKEYSEYAGVNVDDGRKFYYPSPGRNFNLRFDYVF